jgi:hypothetical protein
MLALAAIPPEVAPRALVAPGATARAALRAFGIRPGVAVFEAPLEATSRVVLADCIRVAGRDASGRDVVLAPPGDHCVVSGVRAGVPWTEGALRGLVLRAPAGLAEPLLGDWFCHGPHWRALGLRNVRVAWTQPWTDWTRDESGTTAAAIFEWRCAPPGLERRSLRPSDAELRGFLAW